jgi:hypothetical protein
VVNSSFILGAKTTKLFNKKVHTFYTTFEREWKVVKGESGKLRHRAGVSAGMK